jgi:hypothetical protein
MREERWNITMQTCTHAYTIPIGVLRFCLMCKELVEVAPREAKKYVHVIMPPRIYELTETRWKQITPWSMIEFATAKTYGWYISFLGAAEYLIMPITRHQENLFYSARRLSGQGLKYNYPKGVKRIPWVSSDDLPEPVVICEGVADAAHVSSICSSVALLGNYLGDDLQRTLHGKECIVALDGDPVGIVSAVSISSRLPSSRVVVFPDGTEPTDYTVAQVKDILQL